MQSLAQGTDSQSSRVAKLIEADIRSGKLPPESRLDRVRNLADSYEVSLRVIVSALNILERNRLIQREPRRGVFVSPQAVQKKFLMLCSSNPNHVAIRMILPFEAECRRLEVEVDYLDYELFCSPASVDIVKTLRERNYGGVLFFNSNLIGNELSVRRLHELNLPVVIPRGSSFDAETTGFCTLYLNQAQAWREVIKFLHDSGYRKIGIIGKLTNGMRTLRCGTIEQHVEIMHSFGLAVEPNSLCFYDPAAPETFRNTLDDFMQDFQRMEVIICGSDMYAVQLYNYCFEHGIKIPRDIAVFSYGYLHGGELLQPALANLDPCFPYIGKKSAELLYNADQWFGKEVPNLEAPYQINAHKSCPPKTKNS